MYKTAIGTHGGGTWMVDLENQVNAQVGGRYAFLQEYMEHDEQRHHDLRVYVVGDRIVGAMNRYAPEGEWRTNVALGGEVEDMTGELPERVREIALDSVEAIGLDYAGVDIVQSDDGYYVLEVNPTAGFRGLFKASGVSPAPTSLSSLSSGPAEASTRKPSSDSPTGLTTPSLRVLRRSHSRKHRRTSSSGTSRRLSSPERRGPSPSSRSPTLARPEPASTPSSPRKSERGRFSTS